MTPDSIGMPEKVPDNLVDRLNPKTRLLATFAVLVLATIVHNPMVLGAALATAVGLVRLARLPWSDLRHRLLHLEGFMIVLVVLLPFTVPGKPLLALGPVAATAEGLIRALAVVIKVNISALTVFAMLGSLDPVRIGQAGESLGVPSKFVRLFLFTVRYVSVFRNETNRLAEAMRARGFRPRSNVHTWRTFGNLAGTMVVRSLERARRVDEAMRCRGFAGSMPTVPMGGVRHHDLAFATIFLCAVVGLLVVEFVA